MPIFFPLLADEYGISPHTQGLVLIIPPLTGIIATPLLKIIIQRTSLESVILVSGIVYAFAYLVFGLATEVQDSDVLVIVAILC